MRKMYEWRVLTDDGLLKEPKPSGPYYQEEHLNGYGRGFDTAEEAEKALSDWKPPLGCSGDDFVLVTVYRK